MPYDSDAWYPRSYCFRMNSWVVWRNSADGHQGRWGTTCLFVILLIQSFFYRGTTCNFLFIYFLFCFVFYHPIQYLDASSKSETLQICRHRRGSSPHPISSLVYAVLNSHCRWIRQALHQIASNLSIKCQNLKLLYHFKGSEASSTRRPRTKRLLLISYPGVYHLLVVQWLPS